MAGADSDERATPVRAAPVRPRDEVGDELDVEPARPELDSDLDLDAGDAAARPRPARWILLPLLAGVLLVGSAVSLLLPGQPAPPPPPPPVGAALPVGVSVPLPAGVRTAVDGQYLSLSVNGLTTSEANILLTAPTRVAGPDGELSALPDDPARWLRRQPAVRVTRVNHLLVDGRHAVQIDYRLAPLDGGTSRFSTVPLFCGIGPAENRYYPWAPMSCSRISADARVRTTFVPVDGRVLMAEAYWSREAAGAERMPAPLAQTYAKLLAGLTFVAR